MGIAAYVIHKHYVKFDVYRYVSISAVLQDIIPFTIASPPTIDSTMGRGGSGTEPAEAARS